MDPGGTDPAKAQGTDDSPLYLGTPDQAPTEGQAHLAPSRHTLSHCIALRPNRSSSDLWRALATSRGSRISSSPLSVARA
jgi:hypothetical protein